MPSHIQSTDTCKQGCTCPHIFRAQTPASKGAHALTYSEHRHLQARVHMPSHIQSTDTCKQGCTYPHIFRAQTPASKGAHTLTYSEHRHLQARVHIPSHIQSTDTCKQGCTYPHIFRAQTPASKGAHTLTYLQMENETCDIFDLPGELCGESWGEMFPVAVNDAGTNERISFSNKLQHRTIHMNMIQRWIWYNVGYDTLEYDTPECDTLESSGACTYTYARRITLNVLQQKSTTGGGSKLKFETHFSLDPRTVALWTLLVPDKYYDSITLSCPMVIHFLVLGNMVTLFDNGFLNTTFLF